MYLKRNVIGLLIAGALWLGLATQALMAQDVDHVEMSATLTQHGLCVVTVDDQLPAADRTVVPVTGRVEAAAELVASTGCEVVISGTDVTDVDMDTAVGKLLVEPVEPEGQPFWLDEYPRPLDVGEDGDFALELTLDFYGLATPGSLTATVTFSSVVTID